MLTALCPHKLSFQDAEMDAIGCHVFFAPDGGAAARLAKNNRCGAAGFTGSQPLEDCK